REDRLTGCGDAEPGIGWRRIGVENGHHFVRNALHVFVAGIAEFAVTTLRLNQRRRGFGVGRFNDDREIASDHGLCRGYRELAHLSLLGCLSILLVNTPKVT